MNNLFNFWFGSFDSYFYCQEILQRIAQATPEQRTQWSSAQRDEEQSQSKFSGYDYMIQEIESVAVISVSGQLIPKSSWITRFFGLTGYDELRNAMVAVVNEGSARSMLLDIDSPGGATRGLNDVTDAVRSINDNVMPIHAHSAGMMTSAAYRIGAAAGEIYATQMSEVGSIGVVAIHQEITKLLADEGIKATVLRAGKYKMLGNPYEKLSKLATDTIQGQLDYLYDDFTAEVAANRGLSLDQVRNNAAEGRVFFGAQALEVGLLNGVDSFEAVVKRLDDLHNSPTGRQTQPQFTGAQAMLRRKNVIMNAQASAAIAAGADPAAVAAELPEAAETAAGTETPTEPGTPSTPEENDVPITPASQAAAEEGEGEPSPASAAAESDTPAPVPAATAAESSMLASQLATTQSDLIDAKVSLKEVQTKLDQATAAQSGLTTIAIEAINKMQIGMGQSATDLTHLTGEALISQYASLQTEFNTRFGVGAAAEIPVEDSRGSITPAPAGAVRATSFRKEEK